jgi:hypothetical protein
MPPQLDIEGALRPGRILVVAGVTKGKPGCWTCRRAFEQVRHGTNIQLLSYSLVNALIAFSY